MWVEIGNLFEHSHLIRLSGEGSWNNCCSEEFKHLVVANKIRHPPICCFEESDLFHGAFLRGFKLAAHASVVMLDACQTQHVENMAFMKSQLLCKSHRCMKKVRRVL